MIIAGETDAERQERHLAEDLKQSFPAMYHDLVRVLIKRAVMNERHRCAQAVVDFGRVLMADPATQAPGDPQTKEIK